MISLIAIFSFLSDLCGREEGKRVTTAQESSSGSDIATGIARNTEQQLAIENAMATHKEVQKVKTEFGVMSAGFDNCKVVKERAETDQASKEVVKYAISASNSPNVTARAGHYADRNEAMAVRLALHDKKYCTKEQAESFLSDLCGREVKLTFKSIFK